MTSLDDVFSGEVTQEAEDQVEEVQAEQVEEVVGDVSEGDAETTEAPIEEAKKEEPTTSEEDIEKQDWTLSAVKDERRKRQELEKKLADLEAKNQEPKEIPDIFDDQQAFVDSLRGEFQQELSNAKLDIARSMMMDHHDDYEAMEEKFIELAKDSPALRDQALKQSNPAKFAYEQAKKYEQYKEVQDVDAYKEKIRNELRSEIEAEIKGSQATRAKQLEPRKPRILRRHWQTQGHQIKRFKQM
jgi:hypothetical protein